MSIMHMDLSRLFEPETLAHVGASPNVVQGRFNFTQFIKSMDYQGTLYPVNPKYKEMFGCTCYPSLKDINSPVDLTIIAIPAEKCVSLLKEVPKGMLRFVVIHTSGFGEIKKGHLEKTLLDLSREKEFRIVGPNCMGVFSQKGRIGFWEDHMEIVDRPGSVGFISQSGGIAINAVTGCIDTGININKAVSLGNQIDVSVNDLLEFMGEDEHIRVIAMYVEDVKDGRRFFNAVKNISKKKPVLIWKGGKTEAGKAAALSHTGSMAGDGRVFLSAISQAGGILVDNFQQLFRMLRILQSPFPYVGKNIGVISPGGGNTVNLGDAFSAVPGICLPKFSEGTVKKLEEILPEENVDLGNPMDPGAVGIDNLYGIFRVVGEDSSIDSLFVLFSYEFLYYLPDEVAVTELVDMIKSTFIKVRKEIKKPIYVHLLNVRDNNERFFRCRKIFIDKLNEADIPWADGPFNEAAVTFSRLSVCKTSS